MTVGLGSTGLLDCQHTSTSKTGSRACSSSGSLGLAAGRGRGGVLLCSASVRIRMLRDQHRIGVHPALTRAEIAATLTFARPKKRSKG